MPYLGQNDAAEMTVSGDEEYLIDSSASALAGYEFLVVDLGLTTSQPVGYSVNFSSSRGLGTLKVSTKIHARCRRSGQARRPWWRGRSRRQQESDVSGTFDEGAQVFRGSCRGGSSP